MGLLAAVELDITKRDLDSVWDNLQASLVATDNGITPVAMGIVFETYDIMVFVWCENPEELNRYIIDRMRSIKGVTETTVFFLNDMEIIEHKGLEVEEPGLDGLIMMDVACGYDDHVFKELKEIEPEEQKTFTKFIAHCLHSKSLDVLVGFKGINVYYLDQLFTKMRMVEGVVDILVLLFQRFTTMEEIGILQDKFPWFV